jgi:hypothetical protein
MGRIIAGMALHAYEVTPYHLSDTRPTNGGEIKMNLGQSRNGGCNYADFMRSSAARKSDGENVAGQLRRMGRSMLMIAGTSWQVKLSRGGLLLLNRLVA